MKKTNTGGPAFPRPLSSLSGETWIEAQDGMTLRDYFAGQWIAGWAAQPELVPPTGRYDQDYWRKWAKFAYQMADAMIEARKI